MCPQRGHTTTISTHIVSVTMAFHVFIPPGRGTRGDFLLTPLFSRLSHTRKGQKEEVIKIPAVQMYHLSPKAPKSLLHYKLSSAFPTNCLLLQAMIFSFSSGFPRKCSLLFIIIFCISHDLLVITSNDRKYSFSSRFPRKCLLFCCVILFVNSMRIKNFLSCHQKKKILVLFFQYADIRKE